jgi:hypothetical protein
MKVKYHSLLELICNEIPHISSYFTAKTIAVHASINYKMACFTSKFRLGLMLPKLMVASSNLVARFKTRHKTPCFLLVTAPTCTRLH